MEPIIPDQQALRVVVRQDLSDVEKYRLAQADTLMRLIKADSIEKVERMLSDSSIQQLVQEHNQKMGGEAWKRSRMRMQLADELQSALEKENV
jgi:hypothetical protein